MEFIKKNKEKQKPMVLVNYNDIFTDEIANMNKKEKINFTKSSKDDCNIFKKEKKMIKEFHSHKGKKHNSMKNKKRFNSNKYYIYNAIYNKIYIILYFFMIFFYISSSKQNSDLRQLSSMQEIIITIIGPGMRSIFSYEFRYQPSALYINESKINIENNFNYNNVNLKDGESIIKIYFSNPLESFKNMFKDNIYIKKVDLTNFDTSKVIDMNSMFANCVGLEYVNMTGIDTSSVTDMGSMFQSCTNLISLDLSSFSTFSVLNMQCMFSHCTNLIYLNISYFNTASVTTMSEMFSFCESLESLDLSSFITNKDLDMNKMFYNCKKLKSIKFPEEKKISGLNMRNLFLNCSSLTSLDLSSFDTSNVIYMENMFNKIRIFRYI
jgi:surface protein